MESSGHTILDTLIRLLSEWGYWIVLFGVMLENTGIPIPGETILLAAGFLASQGRLRLPVVIAVAGVGAIAGDNAGYWIGRRLGRAMLLRYGRFVFLTEERFVNMERFFLTHGDKMVAAARFITGFRVFTALFAGAARMRWLRFLFFNVIGAVSWSVSIALLGYFFGKSWSLLEHWVAGAGMFLAGLLIAVLIIRGILVHRRQQSQ
ncbi:MAG TPA: DedA family protein [Blastocatellia bacterium]|nr:DedA family protein [Blastocatellia bacterium]